MHSMPFSLLPFPPTHITLLLYSTLIVSATKIKATIDAITSTSRKVNGVQTSLADLGYVKIAHAHNIQDFLLILFIEKFFNYLINKEPLDTGLQLFSSNRRLADPVQTKHKVSAGDQDYRILRYNSGSRVQIYGPSHRRPKTATLPKPRE